MLTVVLVSSYAQAQEDILQTRHLADAYEFRLDTFKDPEVSNITTLMQLLDHTTIFTLRMSHQGGSFNGSYEERWALLKPYLSLSPSYVDLEEDTPVFYIEYMRKYYPEIKIILSYHNFHHTPESLDQEMQRLMTQKADVYKIATQARSSLDAIRMLHLSIRCKEQKIPFVGICMGELGLLTRLLASIMGHVFNYCYFNMPTAPGQLSIEDLCSIYHYKQLSSETKIYALLGHPVTQSPSHYTHNKLFHLLDVNALYVKIDLCEEEFIPFLDMCTTLPFQGFSITIPFKEKAWSYADFLTPHAQEIGAVNTLYRRAGEWIGANTDATGAIRALEEYISLPHRHSLIIGAGGTARAIAYALLHRNSSVTLFNRTKDKALSIARSLRCTTCDDLEGLNYDVLINTTTVGSKKLETPIQDHAILPNRVVMDVLIEPAVTELLQVAEQKGCKIIHGYTMFIYQAAEQFRLWLDAPLEGIEELLKKSYFAFKARECTCCSSRNL